MNYILVIMTVVGSMSHDRNYSIMTPMHDWRPIGEFRTERACKTAGMELKPMTSFKCLKKDD